MVATTRLRQTRVGIKCKYLVLLRHLSMSIWRSLLWHRRGLWRRVMRKRQKCSAALQTLSPNSILGCVTLAQSIFHWPWCRRLFTIWRWTDYGYLLNRRQRVCGKERCNWVLWGIILGRRDWKESCLSGKWVMWSHFSCHLSTAEMGVQWQRARQNCSTFTWRSREILELTILLFWWLDWPWFPSLLCPTIWIWNALVNRELDIRKLENRQGLIGEISNYKNTVPLRRERTSTVSKVTWLCITS